MPNLGQTLGLVHSSDCKSAYRVWSKSKDVNDKSKMIQAKRNCPLCHFKTQIRQEQIKTEKVGN
jgi:hypothetical protein